VLALLGERRLCVHGGAVRRIIATSPAERQNAALMSAVNERFLALREMLRAGLTLDFDMNEYFTLDKKGVPYEESQYH
jgi:hypothetical protein